MSQKHLTLLFILSISLTIQSLQATRSQDDSGHQWMKGTVSAKIQGVPVEKAWPFLEDFCNVYKVFPLRASFCSKGDPLKVAVGHQRYLVFENVPGQITWERHRLISMDRVNHVLVYRMVDNTNGLSYYRSIISVVVADNKEGSELRWEYVAKSTVFTPETFRAVLLSTVQTASNNIKNATSSSS